MRTIQFAVATNELVTVHTISFFFKFNALHATYKPEDALFTAKQYFEPINFLTLFSNCGTLGPCVKKFDLRTFETASMSFLMFVYYK